MGLVQKLVDNATSSDVPVQDLLRTLKIIAVRSGAKEIDTWVDRELQGYAPADELPSYRGPFEMQVFGHLAGPFGSRADNVPIPRLAFPKQYRDGILFNQAFGESVAELADLASGESHLRGAWPADALLLTQNLNEQGKIQIHGTMVLQQAWKLIPRSMIVSILDTVRSRILEFALSLEDIAPDAGEARSSDAPVDRITQVFHNHIYGSATNVAIGSSQVEQTAILPAPGDERALVRALSAANVGGDLIDELREALAEDRAANNGVDPVEPGNRVSKWMARFALRSATAGVGMIATGAAGNLVSQAIAAYFGMHG